MDLQEYIREIQDFPIKGVIFKDITPLLQDASAFAKALSLLSKAIGSQKIDIVVGVESRGYFFGGALANELNAGFVPVRKPRKLPHDTISQIYDLEYGTDSLEIHKDAIKPGDRVLLHDDVLATGGTAAAAVKLIEKLGGKVVQCNFLIELSFLKGREKLPERDIAAVIAY